MSRPDTVQIVIELPRWLFLLIKKRAEQEGVQPAVYATHLMRIATALKPATRRAAAERLERITRVRELWLRHHSPTDIANILHLARNNVYDIVAQLEGKDRIR